MPIDPSANFLKYDFAITEDLCKQFITVVSGILVFSLTFSEKIINFASASRRLRALLGCAWAALLFAIVACGLGLTDICIAEGQAVYGRPDVYPSEAWIAYRWITVAGISFIAGLFLLITVALASSFALADRLHPPTAG